MTERRNASDFPVSGTKTPVERILAMRDTGMTWRDIGSFLGVSAQICWLVCYKGFVPKRNDLRAKLGFPLVCPRCGEEIEI